LVSDKQSENDSVDPIKIEFEIKLLKR